MSRPYAEVIGDPIAHSKSPLIHNFWLGKLGIDAEYSTCHVPPEGLADYFARRCADAAWRGCNVTIPHKEAVAALIGKNNLLPGYLDFGAVNLVVPVNGVLMAANTDVMGVVGPINSFHDHMFNHGPVPPRKIAVIGGGGAAKAAVFGLSQLGFRKSWRFLVRRPEQGAELAALANGPAEVLPINPDSIVGADILINASPLGMVGRPSLDLPLGNMGSGTGQPLVFEMVYSPLETSLTAVAREHEFAVIDGLDMLIGQAVGAFQHLFDADVPKELVHATREMVLASS
jgi:shikimate dehydrogenase